MKKILAIDDDPINRQLMSVLLSSDFDCTVVSSAAKAIETLSETPYDIIITDINLGGAQDGIWLGKYIKSTDKFKHIPVVAVTAHVLSYAGKSEITEAFDALVQKPLIKQKLIEKLNEMLVGNPS